MAKKKGLNAVIRKAIKYGLFVSGAVGPINTAYDYLHKGSLKPYGLVTTLTLKSVILNCGYVTGLFLAKWFFFYFFILMGVSGFGGLIMMALLVPPMLLWVATYWFLAVASRFNEARARDYLALKTFAEHRLTPTMETAEAWLKEREEAIYEWISYVFLTIALFVNVAHFLHPGFNPLSLQIAFVEARIKALTGIGLFVLVVAYGVGYKQVSDYIKDVQKDEDDDEVSSAQQSAK